MDKGLRAAGWAGQSGQVMSGHGGHYAGYTMCELRYGITAQLFSVNGRRSALAEAGGEQRVSVS